ALDGFAVLAQRTDLVPVVRAGAERGRRRLVWSCSTSGRDPRPCVSLCREAARTLPDRPRGDLCVDLPADGRAFRALAMDRIRTIRVSARTRPAICPLFLRWPCRGSAWDRAELPRVKYSAVPALGPLGHRRVHSIPALGRGGGAHHEATRCGTARSRPC